MNSIDLRIAELVQRRANCVHEVLSCYYAIQEAKESEWYKQYNKIQAYIRCSKRRARSFSDSNAATIDRLPSINLSPLLSPSSFFGTPFLLLA
jgi:hypothetical protein